MVGAGILVGNITGFFRVAITAYLLGTHASADALAVAMGPLDTLNSIIINTMFFAFVPMLMLRQGGDRAALFARAGNAFITIFAFASVAIAALAPWLIRLLGPGLPPEQHEQATMLLRIMAPSTVLAGSAAIYSALLYTDRRFLIPGLYQTCLNGATIVTALTLYRTTGINGFAIGYTAGAGIQLLLSWWAARDLRAVKSAPGREPLKGIFMAPGLFLFYAGLIAANIVLTRAIATRAGSGMAAAVDYSVRCVSVITAYLVYPVATTLVPEISRLRGTGESGQAWKLINRGARLMAIAAIGSCFLFIGLRTPMITFLFQRGSFTRQSTQIVATVFLGLVPSLAGGALMDLLARCLFALDRPVLPVAAAFVPVSVNLIITAILYQQGKLADPALIGTGASAGLIAGFVALFLMIRFRRGIPAVSRTSRRSSAYDPARLA